MLEVLIELLNSKRVGNRRDVYVKSLKHYLKRFIAGRETENICAISAPTIEAWLLKSNGYSRQTWLNRISAFFSFAKRKGYVVINPCDQIERVTIDRRSPKILTPAQAKMLLEICPENCRAYLILGMYAGIRPCGELMKMDWAHINLDTGVARVEHPKVRKHRRIVRLEPLAIKLLQAIPEKNGLVSPSASSVRRFKRKAREALGLPAYPADLLRHTAASYLLALHGDAGKVATMLGNSTNILLNHYHEPVTPEACAEFWKI